ncbi:hypothetical protein Patl1_23873 [Pistacia atlantica]|uniref:Uncharacterized protein n=1 Tax=Pistacia atlantica TaxID=434234 RepID=A0ACC0ZYL2_9ROSI|nr:hypothetical protein Patl1_23873 [Pistacia atlantica]
MDSNKKPKNSCSCFPFNIFNSRRPPTVKPQSVSSGVGTGAVWTQSQGTGCGIGEKERVGSRVSNHQGSYIDGKAENYIDRFYENNQDSDVEVEKV